MDRGLLELLDSCRKEMDELERDACERNECRLQIPLTNRTISKLSEMAMDAVCCIACGSLLVEFAREA